MTEIRGENDGADNGGIPEPDSQQPEEVVLRSLGPRFLVGTIFTEISDLPAGAPITLKDGKLHINREGLEEEKAKVKKALSDSIENGDEAVFLNMTAGLESSDVEELVDLGEKLKGAFARRTKNPFELKSINVDLLTDGIAERNLIREGLKPQIARQPFTFKDKDGKDLDLENDVEFVFAKNKDEGYKIIVGSKKGIAEINVPIDLDDSKFQPDFTKIDKDTVNNSIVIPLKAAKDGTESLVTMFEIHKGPINLKEVLIYEEDKQDIFNAKAARKSSQTPSSPTDSIDDKPVSPTYRPPTPRPPRRSSEGGGYGYTRVSG